MTEDQIAKEVVNAAYWIHYELGPGLYEAVYESILAYELAKKGLQVQRQVEIRVTWDELVFDQGFRADIIVNDKVLVELKSVDELGPKHFKQVLTYLKLTDLKLGLLINFNENLIKNGIKRIANGLGET